jgi:hypothetical protein
MVGPLQGMYVHNGYNDICMINDDVILYFFKETTTIIVIMAATTNKITTKQHIFFRDFL